MTKLLQLSQIESCPTWHFSLWTFAIFLFSLQVHECSVLYLPVFLIILKFLLSNTHNHPLDTIFVYTIILIFNFNTESKTQLVKKKELVFSRHNQLSYLYVSVFLLYTVELTEALKFPEVKATKPEYISIHFWIIFL